MNFRKTILVILLLGLMIAPRLPSLGSFVTVDEPFWLSVGANYYYALSQHEFENTVYEYHPAVTTMSFITAAFLLDFPEYRGYGQGYFDVDKEKFDPFLTENGHDPLYLLYLSRLVQVAAIVFIALLIFFLLSVLLGDEKAFLVTALISSAPYFLGHSRVLSHEAMVAISVLASIFGMMAYLEYERKWYYLLISAAAAALAQLTKSSAMAMFPAIGLMLAVSVFEKMKVRGFKSAFLDHLQIFGVWFATLALVYIILWPGMWVAPGKMLYEVYGNAFSYAFQGSRLVITQELQPSQFGTDTVGGTALTFVMNILESATIITWLGLLLAIASLFIRGEKAPTLIEKKIFIYLFTTAVMFILLFSVAQGKNYRHYIMTSHVCMDAIAALGWAIWLGWLGMKLETANRFKARPGLGRNVQMSGAALLITLQLASAMAFYPYYYTYYNPLLAMISGQAPASNYGEGIEQAATYLAQKPNAESLKVFAYRGRGPFSYFFPGETIILNPLFMEDPGMPAMFERLKQADYIVITDTLGLRSARNALFVQSLNSIAPEHSIYIKGVSPIHIYRVADLPPSFYELQNK
jgi:hypothetical protein